ncbi:MAG: hypothetical protein FWG31_07460 [Oscillospiraceae bacterium]|nr:hypothetical protein [Oscillospiraceae bacterium]
MFDKRDLTNAFGSADEGFCENFGHALAKAREKGSVSPRRAWPRAAGIAFAACMLLAIVGVPLLYMNGFIGVEPEDSVLMPGMEETEPPADLQPVFTDNQIADEVVRQIKDRFGSRYKAGGKWLFHTIEEVNPQGDNLYDVARQVFDVMYPAPWDYAYIAIQSGNAKLLAEFLVDPENAGLYVKQWEDANAELSKLYFPVRYEDGSTHYELPEGTENFSFGFIPEFNDNGEEKLSFRFEWIPYEEWFTPNKDFIWEDNETSYPHHIFTR